VGVFPVDCIFEINDMCVIHPHDCIDCGACIPECRVDAVHADHDLPADESGFLAVNETIVNGEAAADAALAALLYAAWYTIGGRRDPGTTGHRRVFLASLANPVGYVTAWSVS
jgi:hypothetical protein